MSDNGFDSVPVTQMATLTNGEGLSSPEVFDNGLYPIIQTENGEMGILDDGCPYLTVSGLAVLCDVDRKAIESLTNNWDAERTSGSGKWLFEQLKANGRTGNSLRIENLRECFTDHIFDSATCVSILNYCIRKCGDRGQQGAGRKFQMLTSVSLEERIHAYTGFDPVAHALGPWMYDSGGVDLFDSMPCG
jgi:hypothetical protein